MSARGWTRNLLGLSPYFTGGGGGGGVTQIVAGSGIAVAPPGGTGVVTVSATGGGGQPESFCAVLVNDINLTLTGFTAVTGMTTVPDTVTYPSLSGQVVYNNLTLGSFDDANATFNCGVSGEYLVCLTLGDVSAFPASEFGVLVQDITNSNVILTLSYATSSDMPVPVVVLIAGHQYRLYLWLKSTAAPPYTYSASYVALGSLTWPNMFWGFTLLEGVSGGSTVPPESFALAMVNGITLAGPNDPVIIAPLTDTVDTGAFPGLSPKMLHDNLVAPNAVDLTSGVFTVGTAGQYLFQFPTSYVKDDGTAYFALQLNGDLVAADGSILANPGSALEGTPQGSAVLDLLAGDQVQLICSSGDPSQFPGGIIINNTNTAGQTIIGGPNTTYSVVWKCIKISSGSGGGGVQSVVAGSGIAVDDTDPQNPVVSATSSGGAGSGFRAEMTADNPAQASGAVMASNWTVGAPNCFDTGSMFDTSTGIFTCPTTGLWLFAAAVSMTANSGSIAGLALSINGNPRMSYNATFLPTGEFECTITGVVQMTAGQQAWLFGLSSDGTSTLYIDSNNLVGIPTWFSACFVGS